MGWDDYNNNIAVLTGNLIKGFLAGKQSPGLFFA